MANAPDILSHGFYRERERLCLGSRQELANVMKKSGDDKFGVGGMLGGEVSALEGVGKLGYGLPNVIALTIGREKLENMRGCFGR